LCAKGASCPTMCLPRKVFFIAGVLFFLYKNQFLITIKTWFILYIQNMDAWSELDEFQVNWTNFKWIIPRAMSGKVGTVPGTLLTFPANLTRASKTAFSRTLKHMMTGLGVLETWMSEH
jgi:uncharacterized YccA/Bax inhibitor family protein